jgi:Domain of unknown function (DUF3598)
MTPHSVDRVAKRENQLQNWDNFCQYHLGDWHGIWIKYSPEGQAIDSSKCIRSFHLSEDSSQIVQQNRSTAADGKTKLHNFTYVKPSAALSLMGQQFTILFLDNSFSWGATMPADAGAQFFFETGFTHENRRTSLIAVYQQSGELQHMTAISEQLNSFLEDLLAPGVIQADGTWQGTVKQMNPDLATSSPQEIGWQPLENLSGNNLIFHLPGGSISCPFKIESNRVMDLIVDWQAAPNKFCRGIRHFNNSEFSHLLLQVYES